MTSQLLTDSVRQNFDKYLDFLCDICAFEAKAGHKQTIDHMMDCVTSFAKAEGFRVTRTPMEKCGDFLTIDLNTGAEKTAVFLAHTDTVHEPGVFGESPVIRTAERIVAPGAIDCKGGIAIALLAMKALQENGYPHHLRLLLTSDEEVSNILGGQAEVDFFRDNCAGFRYAINCETTENDEVVISRKGILRYRMDISGVGGHSGIHFFECKNALVEAAHKILALQAESRPGGITYSCNICTGGTVANIIPESCSLTVDIRVPRHRDMDTAVKTVETVCATSYLGGTSAKLTLISKRPPMEKCDETMALFRKLQDTCRKYDLGDLTPVDSGGGSDSCYTQAAGVASICGMGGSGEFCHTNREYITIDSVSTRAKLLSLFLMEEMQ